MKKRVVLYVVAVSALALCLTAALRAAGKPEPKQSKVEITGEVKHRFIGGSYHGKIFIVARDGHVVWEYPARNCQDVFMLKNGTILFNTRDAAMMVNRDKKILWEYKPKGRCEVHSAAPLPNGNVLITVSGQSRIIEVDKYGMIAKEIKFADISRSAGNAHMELRDSVKTTRGTYLVAFFNEGLVREFDADGKVLRTITPAQAKPDTASSIVPLPGGSTLIGTGYGRSVIEIGKDDKVVWSLMEKDLDGVTMGYVATAVRLPNGNTLISCYKGTYAFFEVTKDKKVVWSIRGGPFHGTTAIQLLD